MPDNTSYTGKYYMFKDLKTPADLQKYNLFRGTTDFTQLQQFELYESGYPYLVLVSTPKFLQVMAEKDENVVKSAANIPGVRTALVGTMNVYEIINHDSFIVTQEAVKKIEEVYN